MSSLAVMCRCTPYNSSYSDPAVPYLPRTLFSLFYGLLTRVPLWLSTLRLSFRSHLAVVFEIISDTFPTPARHTSIHMSLRRKSCNACFKGRRKCDRGYPICGTCRRTNKSCHYVYAPISSATLPDGSLSAGTEFTEDFTAHANISSVDREGDQSDCLPSQGQPLASASSSASLRVRPTPPKLNISNFLGSLGEMQRMEGSTDSWRWVIGELKRCPRELATRGETLFLHKNLYRGAMPRAIRAALGNSAAFCMLDEDKRNLLFQVVDAEVLELLSTPPLMNEEENQGRGGLGVVGSGGISGLTLMDELARLQAFTLYQMMRIFGGGPEQRFVVEQQRDLLTKWALQLLRRSMAELGGGRHHAPDSDTYDWHTWILAESIRRTVMIVYMFYGMYSLSTQGFCVELPTLAKLPVSKAPASWHSEAAYMARNSRGETPQTSTYEEYTDSWMKSTSEKIDPFDKFLLVSCKGLEAVSP